MKEENTPFLLMKEINKSFYGVPVLKNASISLNKGECVGLIGENGAGKSTLIKILCGAYKKDSGQIFIDGKEKTINSVEDAQNLGIRTIYQELSLFPTLSVAENIFINNEITRNVASKLSFLDINTMRIEAERILKDVLSVDIDVNKTIENIPFSQRQLVEIARAIYSNGQVIIMDEPTTGLETKEKEKLFNVIYDLKSHGKTIIFISHYLDEVMQVCVRIIVLRDGEVVIEDKTAHMTLDDIITSMIGKVVDNHYPKEKMELGNTVLKVENLSNVKDFNDISFDLHEKEIVGIVGLAGCGKNEILRALFGLVKWQSGKVTLNGEELKFKSVKSAMERKIAFLPAERKSEGIFAIQTVSWNTSIAALKKIMQGWKLSLRKEKLITNKFISELGIKVHSPSMLISRLSGGNQQKVMLSRWFLTDPKVLLLEEPTRGIDVNAKVDVYNLIMRYVKQGNSVIMVSSEEGEVLGICDKIIVIHKGSMVATLDREKTSLEEIKRYSVSAG